MITNTAIADFTVNGSPQTAYSNSVSVTTVLLGSPSALDLFRYAPSSPALSLTVGATRYFDGAAFTPAPAPSDPASGATIDITNPVPLEPAANFSQGEPVFLRLLDPDGNVDPAQADTVRVLVRDTGGAVIETLLLPETGLDTGVFTGYVRSGAAAETPSDGLLFGYPGALFTAGYTDQADPSDSSSAPFTFDAVGVLYATASAGWSSVAVGDFLTLDLSVRNTSGSDVPGVVLTVGLPVGFRFEGGTASLNGLPSGDPVMAPDGRSLAFSLGGIPAGGTATVTFVSRVGAGTRPGRAVVSGVAVSGALASNTALARVTVTEDLFRSRSVIMGRVLTGACGEADAAGLAGARIYLEDGTYVITDRDGRYHFEGVRAGSHVVQLDLETVPDTHRVVSCDDDTRQAGRPWSRFVDLAGGDLWRVDFNAVAKLPEEGRTVLVLSTEAGTERVSFNATMRGERTSLSNVRFRVTLPEGVVYEPGSSRLEGEPIADPAQEGGTLTWMVGDTAGAWEKGITFQTRIVEGWGWASGGLLESPAAEGEFGTVRSIQGRMNEVIGTASMTFNVPMREGPTTLEVRNILIKVAERDEKSMRKFVFRPHFGTFEAALTPEDRQALDIIASQFDPAEIDRVEVTGHTDDVPISARGRRVYKDNYALSEARALSVARYLRSVWDIPSNLFRTVGMGPDEPVAPNENSRGRTLNRRVEVNVVTTTVERRTELQPMSDRSTAEAVINIQGEAGGMTAGVGSAEASREGPVRVDPLEDTTWFDSDDGSFGWVWPDREFSPGVPATKVAVKHRPGTRVILTVNGREADPLSFEGTRVNSAGGSALSIWRGIRLADGDNGLQATLYLSDGKEAGRLARTVYLAGRPVQARVDTDLSVLVADGRTPPVVVLRLTDSNGRPARPSLVGRYAVMPPHRAWEGAGGTGHPTDGMPESRGQFLIEQGGIARLTLQPTSVSGKARISLRLRDEDKEIPVWLTARRDSWILVGLAEGTVGYNTVSGNMESFEDTGGDEDLYSQGRMALFAKGKIKGEYLLTLSYDTAGPHGGSGEGHYGTIDPDTYYTLYGDATGQDYEAPTSGKLYLKIEREQFYALFGDTQTGLTVAELSRYDRRITGLRSELKGESFSYNLFASETERGFVRDEIPGDGTSGLYRLSSGDVVPTTEVIRIEVRDRFQSHVILSSEVLTRHLDYSIDLTEGTVFFKKPVPERDAGFNPVFIVVDYETLDPDASGLTYGARGEAALPGAGTKLGVSHIHEDRGAGEGDLTGLDITTKIGATLTVKAETATSRTETLGVETEGSAYLLEVSADSASLTGKVYLRQQEEGFGLGHQNASEGGMRKAGADAVYRLTDSWRVKAELSLQENLDTGADRRVQEVGASYAGARLNYSASVRQALDTDSDGTEERSDQVTAGVGWRSADDRWKLRLEHEQSLGSNANTDYPTRTLAGSDFRVSERVSLYAEQEFTDGDETSVSATRVGLKATPWEGATATTSVDRQHEESGERVYATTGLAQTWQLTRRWKASATFEGASVIRRSGSEPLNAVAPGSSSGEDYAAYSLGAAYALEKWDFNLRLEAR
ncbi:MAG: OmpA family protein, partial [bacterium]